MPPNCFGFEHTIQIGRESGVFHQSCFVYIPAHMGQDHTAMGIGTAGEGSSKRTSSACMMKGNH